jgi:hypothetical protein
MSRDENPVFPRGSTFYDGETIDTNDLQGINLEGMEWVFEDVHPTTGVRRTGRSVRCRCVRNVSGVNLLPKLLATFSITAGLYGQRVVGYSRLTPGTGALNNGASPMAEGYPIDEYLPAAGVPTNDLFWIVLEGPAVCVTSVSNGVNDFSVGTWATAQTAAASTFSTTAGRVIAQALTGATAILGEAVQVRIGRALTALTANQTASDILLDIGHWAVLFCAATAIFASTLA